MATLDSVRGSGACQMRARSSARRSSAVAQWRQSKVPLDPEAASWGGLLQTPIQVQVQD